MHARMYIEPDLGEFDVGQGAGGRMTPAWRAVTCTQQQMGQHVGALQQPWMPQWLRSSNPSLAIENGAAGAWPLQDEVGVGEPDGELHSEDHVGDAVAVGFQADNRVQSVA